MDRTLPLSIALVTLNEEANLPRCLAAARPLAQEVVIVDSGSTDRTEAIAREYGASLSFAPWTGFLAQKNRALERCTRPWVLCLDADEVVSPELAAALRDAFAQGEPAVAGFAVNRRTWYLGDWVCHAWYPDWILRVARREAARWTGLDPHPRLEVQGTTRRLHGDLLHYSFRDLEDHLLRSVRYARMAARAYAVGGRRCGWRQLALSPIAAFVKHLVLKQGWRDGWRGWLISAIRGFDTFAKYAFLLELRRANPAGHTAQPEPKAGPQGLGPGL